MADQHPLPNTPTGKAARRNTLDMLSQLLGPFRATSNNGGLVSSVRRVFKWSKSKSTVTPTAAASSEKGMDDSDTSTSVDAPGHPTPDTPLAAKPRRSRLAVVVFVVMWRLKPKKKALLIGVSDAKRGMTSRTLRLLAVLLTPL